VFPYIEHPTLVIGSYPLQAARLLYLTAIVVEYWIVLRRAPRHGFTSDEASSLVVSAIVIGMISAHVFDVLFYYPERLRDDPLELLRVWSSLSSWGGMVGGLSGLALLCWRRGLGAEGVLRFLDLGVYALPFTLGVGRLGCALQHDHPGIASPHFLAVRFPTGPAFDLGLLEFLYLIPVSLLFFALGRAPRPPGFFLGLFFAVYGPARFAMDMLRSDDARYFGWTPAQYLCVATAIAGAALVVSALRRPRPAPR
jgi:phosphatidylglycerol:prolipoprotein diacylglycerol transferase